MTRRLATMCLMTMFVIGVDSRSVQAKNDTESNVILKGITTVSVLVESLPEGAKVLGLTDQTIKTDIELKLRLAGVRVVTIEESFRVPGFPHIYARVNLTDGAEAADIDLELLQNARLERNGELAIGVRTWVTGTLIEHPNAQVLRNTLKDAVDQFLNDWLSVNPKK